MAVSQFQKRWLIHRYREQARSHRFFDVRESATSC